MFDSDRAGGDGQQEALLYALGDLDEPAATEFEQRLADDQSARDALCAAVRLRWKMTGRSDPAPDPAYRERVRRRLRKTGWGRPADRGNWTVRALVGAAAAATLLLATTGIVYRPERGPEKAPPVVEKQVPVPAAECPQAANDADDLPELRSGAHLAQAVQEENTRKVRAEDRRIVRLEERTTRFRGAQTYKQ